MNEEKKKVTTKELAAYLWEQGDIATKEKVDLKEGLAELNVIAERVE